MLFGGAARLRGYLRFAIDFRAATGAFVLALAFGAAAPAWSACLTATLVLAAPPYTNSQCITPSPDNNGITATGTTYTLNNSGDITVKSTVAKAFPTAAINATSSGDLTAINSGTLSGTATGTGQVVGMQIFQNIGSPTGTVTITNNGAMTLDASAATSAAAAAGVSGGANQILTMTNNSSISFVGNPTGFLLGITGSSGSFTCTGVTCSSGSSNAVTNVTNNGSIVLNAPNSGAIFVSSSGAVSSVNNISNAGTISVNGANSFAVSGFAQITPLTCPIVACTFTFGAVNIANQGQITAGPNAFLFFTSLFLNNPINLINNTGVLDGQLRNPAISAATFTQNDLTNSGVLKISYPGAGLAQIVDGKYTQTSSGTLSLRVNAAGQHDFLTARSTSLSGTLLASLQPGNYANTTSYLGVVQSTAAITTKFDNVGTTSPFFMATATYNTNTVDLTLTRQAFGLLPGLTFNERAVGNALEAGFVAGAASGPGGGIYTALLGLPNVQLAAYAYDQLSGEIHASAQSVILQDSLYAREAILGRLRQFGVFGGGGPFASLGGGGPALAYAGSGSDPALAYADARRPAFPAKAPLLAPRLESDLTFWAQGLGAWGRINGDGNAADLRRDLAGVFTGVDRRFGNWLAGIAAGYTNSTVRVDARASSATIDTAHVAAYAGANYGAVNLRTGADFAWNNIATNRTIAFPGFFDTASARYGAGEAQVFGEVGYGVKFGTAVAEPFGGLAFVHLRTDSFTEAGGIAALAGRSNNEDVGYSTLGVRVAATYMLANGMALTPRASAAWQHAFGDVTPSAALAFQSIGTPFTINGVPIARDAALVSAGADLRVTRQATFGVAYMGNLASNARDNSVKGMFSWKF
jgi:outer membrane autotransporter protein